MKKNQVMIIGKIFSTPYRTKIHNKVYYTWKLLQENDESPVIKNRYLCRTKDEKIIQDLIHKKFSYGMEVRIVGKLLCDRDLHGDFYSFILIESMERYYPFTLHKSKDITT